MKNHIQEIIKYSEINNKEKLNELRTGYEEVQMDKSSIEDKYPEAYRLARKFHKLYEENAPFFGYITNPNSREFYANSNNGRLMAYVCYEIIKDEVASSLRQICEKMMSETEITFELDKKAHSQGKCSFSTTAQCSAVEQEIKMTIKQS